MSDTNLRKLSRYLVASIIPFAVLVMIFMSATGNSQASVKITQPIDGARVDGCGVNVYGSSSGLGNSHLNILIQPIETHIWWTQPTPTVDLNGNWVVHANLGEVNKGNNEQYIIKALITSQNLYPGEIFTSEGMPSSIAQHQIIVTRKDLIDYKNLILLAIIGICANLFTNFLSFLWDWRFKRETVLIFITIITMIVVILLLNI